MEERKLWLIVFIWAESNNALPRGNRFRKIEVQKAYDKETSQITSIT